MFRAVPVLLALILGAAWPATGGPASASPSGLADLWSPNGHGPAVPVDAQALASADLAESNGKQEYDGPALRRPVAGGLGEDPLDRLSLHLSAREAAIGAVELAYLAHGTPQALRRAGLTSSPRTAPPRLSLS